MNELALIPIVSFMISLLGLSWASYTDLKERMVYNKLTYALLAAGLGLHAIQSLLEQSISPILLSVEATILAFAFSMLLWKLGVWAGGDVKLVTAIAALNPINYGILRDWIGLQGAWVASSALPVFFFSWFLFSVFSMIPYGMLLTANALRKNSALRKELKNDARKSVWISLEAALWIAGLESVLLVLQQPWWVAVPMLFLAGVLPKKARRIALALVGIAALAFQAIVFLQGAVGAFIAIELISLFWLLFQTSREKVLQREKKVVELLEGDIVGEWIVDRDGMVSQWKPGGWRTLINDLKNNRWVEALEKMSPKGRVIASPHRAGGLNSEELNEIKSLSQSGKIKETVWVKESAPFVPALLIGFVFASLLGDLFWSGVLFS